MKRGRHRLARSAALSSHVGFVRVVMLVPHFSDRDAECECSNTFADFIARELLPWTREHYRVNAPRARTGS